MKTNMGFCSIVCAVLLGTTASAGQIFLSTSDGEISCGSFDTAQNQLAALFQGVRAEDAAGNDATGVVHVARMTWVDARGRYQYLDLEEAARNSGHFKADEFDYSLAKIQKLFQTYFIFKPGGYEISYEMLDEAGRPIDRFTAKATQLIRIDNSCGGALGCLSCDAIAGCRDAHIPASATTLKRHIGDWLLLGLGVLALVKVNPLF